MSTTLGTHACGRKREYVLCVHILRVNSRILCVARGVIRTVRYEKTQNLQLDLRHFIRSMCTQGTRNFKFKRKKLGYKLYVSKIKKIKMIKVA